MCNKPVFGSTNCVFGARELANGQRALEEDREEAAKRAIALSRRRSSQSREEVRNEQV